MRLIWIILIVTSQFSFLPAQELRLENFAAGFQLPVDITHAGDERLFVVEKGGAIQILNPDGTTNPAPFLDIDPIVNSQANERGLLGLAFHPDYANNGFFFVHYTGEAGATFISRFSVTTNPDIADPNSEKIIFTTSQPFGNHNGGSLKFSPADGYLYIGLGDGGSGGDPQDNGQDGQSYLGKILRLDIDATGPYNIPADNPFLDDTSLQDEIWSYGWRNPWRFSFDKETHDLWVGDVGQNEWEEIDFEVPGDGGRNYGWRCYEGFEQYNFSGCDDAGDYTYPVFVYANSSFNEGCSVTGGFVYRGEAYPSLVGNYIFADYCSGQFWMTRQGSCGFVTTPNIKGDRNEYSAFGEDVNGELYITAIGEGRIYKLSTLCDLNITATVIAPTCLGATDASIDIEISGTSTVSSVEWSNAIDTEDLNGIPAGDYTVTVRDESGCVMERCFSIEDPESVSSCNNAEVVITEFCEGESVVVTAECQVPAGMMVRWFKDGELIQGADDLVLEISESGDYSIQVFDDNCALEITKLFEISEIPASAAPNFTNNGFQLVADEGFFQYIWFMDGVEVQSGTSNIYDYPFTNATYTLQARDMQGCLTLLSDELEVIVTNTEDELGISDLKIYPNPFQDNFTLEISLFQAKDVKLKVLDSSSKKIYSKNLNGKSEIKQKIDLNSVAAGIYMLQIEIDNKKLLKRIVRQ